MKITKEATEFLSVLIKEIPFGILTFNLAGAVTMINSQAVRLLNIEHDISKIIDQQVTAILENERIKTKLKECLSQGLINFTIRPLELEGHYLHIKSQKLLDGMLLIILDETEIVKTQFQATQNLILGQEAERGRLAKEIHDSIGPLMSTIRLQVDNLIHSTNDVTILEKLNHINELIGETSVEIRQISHDLMPSSLKDFGLITSVENLVNNINRNKGIKIHFEYKVENHELESILEINLFRIIQELINNALKHSKATEIYLQLRRFEKVIQLTFEDNGKGMDIKNVKPGMGLSNMTTRVKSLKGHFEFESKLGNGFHAHAVIPIN